MADVREFPVHPFPADPRTLSGLGSERTVGEADPDSWQRAGWQQTELLLAFVVTLILGMRLVVFQPLLLSLGTVLVLGLIPLWIGVMRRYVGGPALLILGVIVVGSGAVLSLLATDDHLVRRGQFLSQTLLVLGLLGGFGFLLWAREKLGEGVLAATFGLGLAIGVSIDGGALFSTGFWKFGYSVAVTVLVLGLAHIARRRVLELVLVVILMTISAVTDARSSFAVLLLTATLLAWQLRPTIPSRRGSAIRGAVILAVVAAVVYNVGQSLILAGVLGAKTQARSLQQVDAAGSLILGGRPELAATLALMRDHFWGYGSGTIPNLHDINTAKAGMATIRYDPNNGYVENRMFGNGYSLHSITGELWAPFGLLGLAFAALILVLVVRRLSLAMTSSPASAVLLYLALRTMWNLFFAPWYSSLAVLMLTLALVLTPRQPPGPDRETAGVDTLPVR